MKPIYTIEKHKHISAAWGAATAARASNLCRFPVYIGRQILEESGFTAQFKVSDLPLPEELDEQHAKWRCTVIERAAKQALTFTHGIAAKLINCYLKDRFVCGGDHDHDRVRCLHPPIDALLLLALAKKNFGLQAQAWRKFHEKRWSKFDSGTYQDVIDLIRATLPAGEPMWKIEEYWNGHQ
jgi:hypothetical protein